MGHQHNKQYGVYFFAIAGIQTQDPDHDSDSNDALDLSAMIPPFTNK